MLTGYTIGRFDPKKDWRDELKEKVPGVKWVDPRNNEQSSIKRLNNDDFGENGVNGSYFSYGHVDNGKVIGTTSYAEVGDAWALGKPLIIADENSHADPLLEEIFSYLFPSDEEAAKYLRKNADHLKAMDHRPIRKKGSISSFDNILFAGDLEGAKNTIERLSHRHGVFEAQNISEAKKLIPKTDLVVINFEKGYNPVGVSYLGIAYGMGINSISLDGNKILYPPLTGLAKIVFMGDNRGENFMDFIQNPRICSRYQLSSQIESAKAHARSAGLESDDKTKKNIEYNSIYFSGSSWELMELKENMKGKKEIHENFSSQTDLAVIEISNDIQKNQKSFWDIAYAYEMRTPVLLLHEGDIAHRELIELSRRPLFGEARYQQAREYLENLKSQIIEDEAKVYYNLMNKFNSV